MAESQELTNATRSVAMIGKVPYALNEVLADVTRSKASILKDLDYANETKIYNEALGAKTAVIKLTDLANVTQQIVDAPEISRTETPCTDCNSENPCSDCSDHEESGNPQQRSTLIDVPITQTSEAEKKARKEKVRKHIILGISALALLILAIIIYKNTQK
jgi:hypothetical protein